jgi:chorismate synthase
MTLGSYVISVGTVQASIPQDMPYLERFRAAEQNDIRTPVEQDVEAMRQHIWDVMQAKDTVGGVFEVVALDVPPGLGSHVHWDRRLDAKLIYAVASIHAIKGVEVGPAFENASLRGSQVHDEIFLAEDGESLVRHSNRAGGFEGGITTGSPVVVRAAMKPISTVLDPRRSVDLASGDPTETVYERSDFCAVPRAAVVGEAMVCITLAEALLEKLGGDSLQEMEPRFATLRRARLEDLPMDNVPWRFGYDWESDSRG